MKLYKNDSSSELVWEDEIVYEEKLEEYILQDDVKHTYNKWDEIDFYYQVDEQDQSIYLAYCKQENWIASNYHVLKAYMGKANS